MDKEIYDVYWRIESLGDNVYKVNLEVCVDEHSYFLENIRVCMTQSNELKVCLDDFLRNSSNCCEYPFDDDFLAWFLEEKIKYKIMNGFSKQHNN